MQTIEHTQSFDLPYPIDTLFPLFSPEGEKLWVPGWDYVNIAHAHPLRENGIFLTRTHDHAGSDAIWLVKTFEPNQYLVQFYKIEPNQKVGLITVACAHLPESDRPMRTRTSVTYQYTTLSEDGTAFINGFDETAYAVFINEWRDLLIQYFEGK